MITYTMIGEWFYDPYTGRCYRFIRTKEIGTEKLIERVCQSKEER